MTASGATVVTLTINDTTMTSDHSAHTARQAPDQNGWEVSRLSGQILDRNTAVTAMILAGTARTSGPLESGITREDGASPERADPEAGS